MGQSRGDLRLRCILQSWYMLGFVHGQGVACNSEGDLVCEIPVKTGLLTGHVSQGRGELHRLQRARSDLDGNSCSLIGRASGIKMFQRHRNKSIYESYSVVRASDYKVAYASCMTGAIRSKGRRLGE